MEYLREIWFVIYAVIVIGVMVRIIMDNREPSKTMAWVLVLWFLPLLGIIPEDGDIPLALNRGIPLGDTSYYAQRAYENIAKRITGQRVPLLRARW